MDDIDVNLEVSFSEIFHQMEIRKICGYLKRKTKKKNKENATTQSYLGLAVQKCM